jgi:putative CocE/NonD family hydrolase
MDGAAAVYGYSGWFDGGYARAAIERHGALAKTDRWLRLGPWSHGGTLAPGPNARSPRAEFDQAAELLRFFDLHLRGLPTGLEIEPRVQYFTMGAETWRGASSFPPPGVVDRPFFLDDERRLSPSPGRAGADAHRVDLTTGAGHRSRWRTLLNPNVLADYPTRRAQGERSLVYTSAPLERDLEVTGEPWLVLELASSEPDGAFFAYLEELLPDGAVRYVTEGQLRAIHRRRGGDDGRTRTFLRADAAPMIPGEAAEIAFPLLPTSYLFRRGNCLRLALAGADRDHFTTLAGAPSWVVHRGGPRPSRLDLPVLGG